MSVVNYFAANEATRVRRLATDTDVPAKAALSCKSQRAGAPCPLYYPIAAQDISDSLPDSVKSYNHGNPLDTRL